MFKNSGECYASAMIGFMLLMLPTAMAINASLNLDLSLKVEFNGQQTTCNCKMRTTVCSTRTDTCERCPSQVPNMTLIFDELTSVMTPNQSKALAETKINSLDSINPDDYRIPTDLSPFHYRVELFPNITAPNPANFTFKGYVRISLKCYNATDKLYLHSRDLTIQSIKFSKGPQILSYKEDKPKDFLIIQLDSNTTVGKTYCVVIRFTSPLKNNPNGLYYSQYIRNETPRYLVASYLKPTKARWVFPCHDEPNLKAIFEIVLTRPNDYTALSNMPLKRSSIIRVDGATYVNDVFEWTPKISTYLLAFIICDFSFMEKKTENGALFRVWSRPELIKNTTFAFEHGAKAISFYERFFNVRFPLQKLDIVAIPDHENDGMENWGLIIIREDKMMTKENKPSLDVATIVNHYTAHQWFGGISTPKWWDDQWLKEGLVNLVGNIAVYYAYPDWLPIEYFVLDKYSQVLISDSKDSSHPIYQPALHPSILKFLLDTTTLQKTPAVLRMLRHFLGFETFRKGLKTYLDKGRIIGSVNRDDLWTHFTEQARLENKNIDVKEVMDTWTLQMNYPLVTVTRDKSLNGVPRVKQERFLEISNALEIGSSVSPFNYTWNIPLTFASNKTRNFKESELPIYWLWRNETSKLINASELLPSQDTWFICNINMNGYYRVNYDRSNWMALAKQLNEDHEVIPVLNRIQIITDALALAKSNHLSYDTVFSIFGYLENEREDLVWGTVAIHLDYVDRMLLLSPVYGLFQSYMRRILKGSYLHIRKNVVRAELSTKEVRKKLYTVSPACHYELPECVDDVYNHYNKWVDDPSNYTIDKTIEDTLYCSTIAKGDEKEWNSLFEMYKSKRVPLLNLVAALTCTKVPWLLQKLWYMLIDDYSPIPKQYPGYVFFLSVRNPLGRILSWNFFRANFNKLKELYLNSNEWGFSLQEATNSLNTELENKELKEFILEQKGNFGTGEDTMQEAIQIVENNIQWMRTHYNTIADWLKTNVN